MADKCAFKYVKTGPGELSGPSMIRQTELAINEICELAAEGADGAAAAQTTADEALRIANEAQVAADNADAKAEEALANAQTAQDTADSANALANQALEEARAAQSEVDSADARIDALEQRDDELAEAIEKAQETADAAVQDAATAQAAAEAAQESADAAQETADTAVQDAATAQAGVDTNAADIASLDSQISIIQAEISQMSDGMFEYDENTTDIDALNGQAARLYLTQECTTVPDGVEPPYWVWNYLRDDSGKTLQFLRTEAGELYNREGTYSAGELEDGSAGYSFTVPHIEGEAVTLTVSVENGALGATATQGDVNGPYLDAGSIAAFTVSMSLPLTGEYADGDEIIFNGGVIARYADGGFTVNAVQMSNTYCNLTPTAASIDTGAGTLDLTFSGEWRQTSGAVNEWSEWAKSGSGGGGETGDYVTLDTKQTITAVKTYTDQQYLTRPVGENIFWHAKATGGDNGDVGIGLGIGTGGNNRGIWDDVKSQWMIHYDSSGQLCLDGTSTVGSSTNPIYLNKGVPTACTDNSGNYVTTNTAQTITGDKTFTSQPYVERPLGQNCMYYTLTPDTDIGDVRIGFGIGTSGTNRGIYDSVQEKWLINYNANGDLVLDGSTTVGSSTNPIYLNKGVPTACSIDTSNYVTTNTAQTISGAKTFSQQVEISRSSSGASRYIVTRSDVNWQCGFGFNAAADRMGLADLTRGAWTIASDINGNVWVNGVATTSLSSWTNSISVGDVTTYTALSSGVIMFDIQTTSSDEEDAYVYVNDTEIYDGYGENTQRLTIPVSAGDVVSSNVTMLSTVFVPLGI